MRNSTGVQGWLASHYHRRLVLGFVLVVAGLVWRIRGPIGSVEVTNERVPDVRAADLIIVPIVFLGLLLIASRPRVRRADRIVGTGLLILGGLWLVTKHPLAGPVILYGPNQHGVHAGDPLAAVPLALGLHILARSRVPPRRMPQGASAGEPVSTTPRSPQGQMK